ncbi:MAG: crossover junction endodeoxyribonuclease RuvC [Gammaproteobacteria bacterium]|nr:crossover junction endodeoxyribonuclease RuvC [Gammaproteobacteria bacterium]
MVLGIDHATVHAGIALMENDQFIRLQAVNAKGHEGSPMAVMYDTVRDWIETYHPDVVALEKPMALRNGDVARKLIEVYAACKLAAERSGVRVVEVTPQVAKQYTAGHGQAEKEDVARSLQARFGLEYDAIAIPVYYKDKKRKGQVRERLFDVSDACALCVAAREIVMHEVREIQPV